MIRVDKLKKTGGSRFHELETFRVVCTDPNELEMFLSLQNSNTEGMDIESFVHVAVARMPRFSKQCVIKTNVTTSLVLQRELQAMQLLQNYPYVVQYLCHFTCIDDKKRWKHNLRQTQFACDPSGKKNLTFTVMEYVRKSENNKSKG